MKRKLPINARFKSTVPCRGLLPACVESCVARALVWRYQRSPRFYPTIASTRDAIKVLKPSTAQPPHVFTRPGRRSCHPISGRAQPALLAGGPMTHSLSLKKCWLTRRTLAGCEVVQYFFLLALPPAPHCLPVIFTRRKKTPHRSKNRALIAITCAITAPLALTK